MGLFDKVEGSDVGIIEFYHDLQMSADPHCNAVLSILSIY
jgi:hypothetical protein